MEGLKIFKDKDAPVVLERSEYPDWVNDLATPRPTLAQLRKMPAEEATDQDIRRYFKLIRKQKINQQNQENKKKK